MTEVVRYGAPGRVNLIGEHTDYNLGYALPMALPNRTVATLVPDDTASLTVHSDREADEVTIALDTAPGDVTDWAAYVAGVVWALRSAGRPVVGGRMSLSSDVELGAGLSSSAALECAVLGAITTATAAPLDHVAGARIAQHAENEYVGAPTGLMDQLASLCGRPRHALLIDFSDAGVVPVPFDPATADVTLLLINSHAPHQHAGGEYAARRAACERAAAELGVQSLREVQDRGVGALDAVVDPVAARRARHVLTENQRVLDAVTALAESDFATVGRIFTASHVSMRDDFEITTAQLDLIAESAVRAGALGARMTGGGFGGCVIALAPLETSEAVADAVRQAMADAGYPRPTITPTVAGAGAGEALS